MQLGVKLGHNVIKISVLDEYATAVKRLILSAFDVD